MDKVISYGFYFQIFYTYGIIIFEKYIKNLIKFTIISRNLYRCTVVLWLLCIGQVLWNFLKIQLILIIRTPYLYD